MDRSVLQIAIDYKRRGWQPIPVPYKSKNPNRQNWENLILSEDDLPKYFNGHSQNIGNLLGRPSGGLTDIDTDASESVKLAPRFLPNTQCIFGRASKRRSHWEYIADPTINTEQFRDVGGKMLVEYRSTGVQTIFPGSTHESNEPITWDLDGEPAKIDGNYLRSQVARLAAATILARHYPSEGSRQDAVLALAGGLLRGGVEVPEAQEFIRAIATCAGDEEAEKRVSTVGFTANKLKQGQHVTGWPRLADIIGKPVVDKAYSWLGMSRVGRNWDEDKEEPMNPNSNSNANIYSVGVGERSREVRRVHIDAIQFRGKPEPPPLGFVIPRFVAVGLPGWIFGGSGVGKTYFGQYAGLCAATGNYFFDLPVQQCDVAYLDFEYDVDEQHRRLLKICRGMGLTDVPERFHYFPFTGYSFAEVKASLEQWKIDHPTAFYILDSFGAASTGSIKDEEKVIAFMREVIGMKLHGLMIIDQQSKMQSGDDYGSKSPFGSTYKEYFGRAIWQLELMDSYEGAFTVLLRNRKTNVGPKWPDWGVEVKFVNERGRDLVTFGQADITQGKFAEKVNLETRIIQSLDKDGEGTAQKVAERLTTAEKPVNENSVLTKLGQLRKRGAVTEVGKEGKQIIYDLCAKVAPSAYNSNSNTVNISVGVGVAEPLYYQCPKKGGPCANCLPHEACPGATPDEPWDVDGEYS